MTEVVGEGRVATVLLRLDLIGVTAVVRWGTFDRGEGCLDGLEGVSFEVDGMRQSVRQ